MRLEVPFTNEFRQVINVGDSVIIVTETYKRVNVLPGTYIGTFINGGRFPRVQVKVPGVKSMMKHNETGELLNWVVYWYDKTDDERKSYTRVDVPYERIATLQLNRIYKAA